VNTFAVRIDRFDDARWAWLLDFALAGLAFDHSFDLLLGPAAAAELDAGESGGGRYHKQIAALNHHGLGQVVRLGAHTIEDPIGYRHVFRF